MQGRIEQVSVSNGGVPKYRISAAEVTPLGLAGDRHAHPNIHGGPRKAVLIVFAEAIELLKSRGFPIYAGALGENLTVRGIDHSQVSPGQRFRAGTALLEITEVRRPCDTLDVYGAIQGEIFDGAVKSGEASSPRWGMSGFYAAVVEAGWVRTNDIISLVDQAV
jgi:MOSC domain-containing protein YiiM